MITLANACHVLYGCSLGNNLIDFTTKPVEPAIPTGYLEAGTRCLQMEFLTLVSKPLVEHLTGSSLSFGPKVFIWLSPVLVYWIESKIENEKDFKEKLPLFLKTALYKMNANFDTLIKGAIIIIGVGEVMLRPRIYVATTVVLLTAGGGVKLGFISEQVHQLYLKTVPWISSAILLMSHDPGRQMEGGIYLYLNIRFYLPNLVAPLEGYFKSRISHAVANLPQDFLDDLPEEIRKKLEELEDLSRDFPETPSPQTNPQTHELVTGKLKGVKGLYSQLNLLKK